MFTSAGWLLGILLVVGLAVLGEVVLQLEEGSGGQAAVGIGMGAGVGFMQWMAIRNHLTSAQRWFWFSLIGFSHAYVFLDLLAANVNVEIKPEMATPLATAAGAFISGWLQYKFVLKKITPKAIHWIAYTTLSWVSAHILTSGIVLVYAKFTADIPRAIVFILVLSFLCIGGPLVGYITGRFIVPRIQTMNLQSTLDTH